MLAGPIDGLLAATAFGALLLAGCVWDLRTRRIPNLLVGCIALGGLANWIAVAPGLPGAARAIGGLAVGFAIWIPFYLLRLVGAGDVKFFAAASAWLGPGWAVQAALLAAVFGAALALAWMVWTDGWRLAWARTAFSLQHPLRSSPPDTGGTTSVTRRVPYALAMTAGLAVAAWIPHLPR